MRAMLFSGAVVVALWGLPALAQEEEEIIREEEVEVIPEAEERVEREVVVIEEEEPEEEREDLRGLTVVLGGGVEGYAGNLAPSINPGPTWGVRAAIRPTRVIGVELGYTGAANELEIADVGGADLVRNGGEAVATFGLTATAIQPYLMGGAGLNWYDVRTVDGGLQSDVNGSVPLGGGLRTHLGNFTADARFNYNFLFDQDFAPVPTRQIAGVTTSTGGRYAGTLNIGATF